MRTLFVIPVFDEAATVGDVVRGARPHGPVLVVDDGSGDGSGAVAERAGAEVLRHPRRLGKAQALLTGVAAARRRGAAQIVTLDGDGQHDPAAIPALLAAASQTSGRTVIVGSRCGATDAPSATRRNAVRVASFFASWTSGLSVRDSQSGFRVYPLALFDEVRTRRGGFVFETEILLAAAACGWTVAEVEVPALPRVGERSRFRPVRDGVAVGTFLAARVAERWVREARVLASEVVGVFDADRLATRHTAMLDLASPYADSPARWSAAIGAEAARRAGHRLGNIWRDVRARRTTTAALATLAAPVTLPLVLLQAMTSDRLPDLVTPLVDAIYGPDDTTPAGARRPR